jgi:hypothetical protein
VALRSKIRADGQAFLEGVGQGACGCCQHPAATTYKQEYFESLVTLCMLVASAAKQAGVPAYLMVGM